MNKLIKVLATLAIVVFCLHVFSDNKADVDLWGNVGFVKAPPWTQDFKYVNTFSFTEPQHQWFNHEWLGQYLLHVTYTHLGNLGLLALKLILGLCVIAMIYLAMRESCKSGPVKFLWLLLVISTMGYGFSTRPHLFTYVLYTFFLLSLWKDRSLSVKHLFLIPLLGIIWVNLHGAFFIGLILLILYLIFELIKAINRDSDHLQIRDSDHLLHESKTFNKWSLSLTRQINGRCPYLIYLIILFIAASFVNPYGLKLWRFIFYSATIFRPYLSEWAPFTRIEYLGEHIDFVILSLLSIFAVCFSRKVKDITRLGILFALFIAAIMMRRNIPLFAITAAFVVPQYIEDAVGRPLDKIFSRISQSVAVVILSLFIVISAYYTLTFNKENPVEIEVPQDRFPADIISFMKANEISGNALVFFDWAEYCIWRLYPDCRVFLDGRLCSAYSLKAINDYFNFLYLGRDWENALKNYPTDIVLIHKANPAYVNMLSRVGWMLVYEDKIAGLFLKRSKHTKFFTRLEGGEIKYPIAKDYEYFP